MTRILDISPLISPELAVWPGDVAVVLGKQFLAGNVECGSLHATLHVGAHADAPRHVIPGGASMDEVDLDPFFGPCEVIEIHLAPRSQILPKHLMAAIRAPRVLFKTTSSPDPTQFTRDFVGLSPSLITHLAEQGCKLVGIDTPSVDPFDSELLETHHALFDAGLCILEGLDLRRVGPGLYTLVALPLRIQAGDASPVRAVLLQDGQSGTST